MKSGLLAGALVAGMICAWTGEASAFSLYASQDYLLVKGVSGHVEADVKDDVASFDLDYSINPVVGSNKLIKAIYGGLSIVGTGSVTSTSFTPSTSTIRYESASAAFVIPKAHVVYSLTVEFTNGTTQDLKKADYYTAITGSAHVSQFPGHPPTFDSAGISFFGYDQLLGNVVSSSGSFDASTVPLPASAPMLGLALLTLGAGSYGWRRARIG